VLYNFKDYTDPLGFASKIKEHQKIITQGLNSRNKHYYKDSH